QQHAELLKQARERAGDYLLAVLERQKLIPDSVEVKYEHGPPRQKLVDLWETFLQQRIEQTDPLWTPWQQLTQIKNEAFGAEATAYLNDAGNTSISPLIRQQFIDASPQSLVDVAAAYGKLLTEVDQQWQGLIAMQLDPSPNQLPEAELEQVRRTLYGPQSLTDVPVDQAGRLFEQDQQNKITDIQRKIPEWQAESPGAPPRAMVMRDRNKPVEPVVFLRGAPDRRGPKVPRRFPRIVTGNEAAPFSKGSGRLELAEQVVSADNPLTARVFVNRIWMQHFGSPLVATPSDFGTRSDPPTHPELLDWLAAEFVRSGWSLKQLHRLIMTSTTWRQSAATDNETVMAEGILLARKRLLRLDAETIRDRMLAASGQLDRTLHGPPLPIKEDDTGQVIVDGSQTRRSMYIQWRRSRPVAMLQAFDAPVMETNCELRTQSTVATQSLILLNGEFILAQADRLAARAAAEAVSLPAERLATLPEIPGPLGSDWQYGFGDVDATGGQVASFTKLAHFDGSRWQMGPVLPDPQFGYVFLNATGGHPDAPGRAVIRRWTAPAAGSVMIGGTLSHGSPNGDGVRGRIYSSREGIFGEWTAFNAPAPTGCGPIRVEAGDTLDFVTDCRDHHTSDSFNWPVTLTVQCDDGTKHSIASQTEFRGPPEVDESLPEQIVRAWQLALCREPTDDELQLAVQFAADQILTLHQSGVTLPENRTAHRQALVSLCQSLLGCNEFLYVD
ncbi:MAG: DUF1553 domain-containing protein, partial [Planctomycetaceae bacterium]|nr:DUF1553 domain-containing protein [Planctomycetaceae bacterium]